MKKSHYFILLACTASMALLGGCGKAVQEDELLKNGRTEAAETEVPAASEEDEQTEPSAGITFEAQDLEGNTVTESVFSQSGLTMVNVWATYCNPCLSEMPGLGELAGEYEPEEFQIIGIISDVQEGAGAEAEEYAAALVSRTGADYPHLLLNESLFLSMLSDVSAVPTTFFVDDQGEILETVVGAMDKPSWKEKIDAFLEE